MNTVSTLAEKKDKYEQLLLKYDWNSPYPPRGYKFGVGRGAKAFCTSAELSSGAFATSSLLSEHDKTGFLDVLDRLEENRQKRRRKESGTGGFSSSATDASREKTTQKKMISMEDLATIGGGVTSQSLVKRKARTEDMEVVDDYAFADETTVVTMSDLLSSHTLTTNQTLQNILEMGSPTEQTTWITHSRVFREMGMKKKAQQALIEGCKLTGSKGPLIWRERLEYNTHDPAVQRQILEEAVRSCPGCEELWLLLLDHKPSHEQINCLQQAVISCPTSESLWIRVLAHVSTPKDQRKIIRKALELTPRLPSLWAMLARLESYDTGKAIFNAAAAEHPSLQLVVEAAKFEEFHLNANSTGDNKKTGEVVKFFGNKNIESILHQASQRFFAAHEEKSRKNWLEAGRTAALERYVITSAYIYLHFVSDKKATGFSLPTTWIDDLMALAPDMWHTHDVLCAIWAAMLISHQTQSFSAQRNFGLTNKELEVITAALQSAPLSSMEAATLALKRDASFVDMFAMSKRELKKETENSKNGELEEEEEELPRPVEVGAAFTVADGFTTSSTAASESLPLPVIRVFLWTLLHTPLLCTVDLILCIAKVLYDCEIYEGALHVLQLGILRHPTSTTLLAAEAKSLVALGRETQAVEVLRRGAERASADTDVLWVKLAVHLRSKHEDIVPVLENAICFFPASERLWLMRLQAEEARIRNVLNTATAQGVSTAPLIAELRKVYSRALSAAHCRFSPILWCYVAVKLESDLLSHAAAARALLVEGVVVCSQRQQPNRRAEIYATFGLARCRVELMHAGRETALEVVKETLQQLPKKDGCFTVPVSELVALSIDLESPAVRGRAAAQAIQHWRVRDSLVFASVAKVYHSAGKHERALEEAFKAAKIQKCRCGDAVALWLKLALLPCYKRLIGERMGVTDEAELANNDKPFLVSVLLTWLWEQVTSESNNANGVVASCSRRQHMPMPNSGPLWVHVSKAMDPSNVTLLGYRESMHSMLQQVMNLIKL